MKLNFTRLFTLLFLLPVAASSFAQSDLIISEYVEGSSNNKAIELYNPTSSTINLTAGNYLVQMYFNGSTSAGTVVTLNGSIAPGAVFVLAHGSASFASASFVNQTNSSSWYNGDDAVVLRKGGAGGTIVDMIGQLGADPGTEWGSGLSSTENNTLRRNSQDCNGVPGGFTDPSISWVGFAQDEFGGLGSHTASCNNGPSITITSPSTPLVLTTTPGDPSAQQSYTIQGSNLTEDITVTVPALSDFRIATVSGGPYTTSLTIPLASPSTTIYIIYHPAGAGVQSGNVTHVSGTASANLAVQGSTNTGGGTPIYIIQGSGMASGLVGNTVTTEGIVTADFQGANQLGGFFLQDTTGDGNNLTSDGIFVFNTSFAVNVGDYVRLTGEVDEFFEKTELKNLTSLSVLSSGNPMEPAIPVSLPVSNVTDLERYEGMLVIFPQTLTATETFTLGRFGEVSLSADGRVFNPTNFVDPNDNPASGNNSSGTSNVAAVTAQQNLNDRRRILLDDGSTVQNPAVVPYLNPVDTTLRSGSIVTNLTGALDFDFSTYRLHPTVVPAFNYAPRPAVPSVGASNVKVASFNVLNYFNGNGSGGDFPTERGAHTLTEFNRQRVKIIDAIARLNADVVGLIEIENDGDGASSAIADLVNGLNAVTGSGTYAYIQDPEGANGGPGTDAIKVALIYKPGTVTPNGLARADMNTVHNRPPLAQTFTLNSNGEKFTVIVNHFKSKSCSGASGANADQGDGQACYNATRKLQATALLSFISGLQTSTGDNDVISLGDYNAYEQEDPMDILAAGGLVNLLPNSYSYVFEGQSGSLDVAVATSSLVAAVTGAAQWHINADEPIAKDYNQEFNQPYLYSAGPYRSSDHDPVLIGLRLQQISAPVLNNIALSINEDDSLVLSAAQFKNAFIDNDTLVRIRITQLPSNGTLKLGASPVLLNQEIAVGLLNDLNYVPAPNFSGTDSIGWNGFDGSSYAAASAKVYITIAPVNDAPVVSIANPVNGASFPAGSTVTLQVNASDTDGNIVKVEFYDGAGKFGEDLASPFTITGQNVEPGSYVLTVKAFDNLGDSTVSDTVRITVTSCAGSGSITAEGYTNIPGSYLINLGSNPNYPNNPDVVTTLNKFEYGPDLDNNYGARVRGYICAPQTGDYIFYIASDEQSELWLSTDENPANIRRIAYVDTRVGFKSWFVNSAQRSLPIRLIKGARYYVETVHKEGTGTDHLSVSWRLPNGVLEGPIPGSRLSPIVSDSLLITGAAPEFGEAMRAVSNELNDGIDQLKITATPNPSTGYFTIRTRSNSEERLVITVTDILGRVVEKRSGITANGTIQLGSRLTTGTYLVEVIQGQRREKLKLVKQ